jgi:hypothetical protein
MFSLKDVINDIANKFKLLEKRVANLELKERHEFVFVQATAYTFNATIDAGLYATTVDIRPVPHAKGVTCFVEIEPLDDPYNLYFNTGDVTPDVYSPRIIWKGAAGADVHYPVTQSVIVPVNSEGKLRIYCTSAAVVSPTVTLTINGYWT